MANDSKVVRQTPATSTTKGKTVVQEGEKNVLYKYRSVTYNLTFSGLRTTDANNPSSYRYSSQDLVIIKSGGKGTAGISTDVTAIPSAKPKVTSTSSQGSVTSKPTSTVSKLPPANKKDRARSELVAQFNKESPGRFDMYIENLEIDTVIEPTKTTVMTQPTSIKFDVIEPYSLSLIHI